jgi:hypothetical protein
VVDEPVEGLAGPAAQAALVEDGADLAAGVAVEELVDGGDGFAIWQGRTRVAKVRAMRQMRILGKQGFTRRL